ncbi:hypothetical protein V483_3386 [Bordetella pertussis CHLA-11]|nr:hypothetical protein V483_3386 [Bordetella pertussis CHLA-11]
MLASTPPRHRARCTHLQTQPGQIQPIDSSHLAAAASNPTKASGALYPSPDSTWTNTTY